MPTSVSVARQCLTAESAHALDEAVAVARRRGHAQTTSLHAVSALLSLPSSGLRDACARSHAGAGVFYSSQRRLQFKALELCLGVSLDRIQSGQPGSENDPPVSNSLMAAIKRSQAHQRRLPENFRLYHEISQQNQSQTSVSCVKVELRQLIISILDDPVVSRVFAEAGFRSSEIKLSIFRPIPQVLRYHLPRVPPPLFLCNLTENPDSGIYPGRVGFANPYPGFNGFFPEDGNNTDIAEILAKERRRNPLLKGASAYRTLTDFIRSLEKRKDAILPNKINTLTVINLENELSGRISDNSDKSRIDTRFESLGRLVETNSGAGVLINYGNLNAFTKSNEEEHGREFRTYVVGRLSELFQRYRNRVWLIGAAPSDEVYYKFLRRFPNIENNWDLHLMTITSRAENFYPKSSLMESFVPFGGFFSTPSEIKTPILRSCREDEPKTELVGFQNTGSVSSLPDRYQSSLPSWLQVPTEVDINKPFVPKNYGAVCMLSGNVTDCLPHQNGETGQRFPSILGFKVADDKKEDDLNATKSSVTVCLSGSTGSAKSVTTDLGLGICSVSGKIEPNRCKIQNDFVQSQSSSFSSPDINLQFHPNKFKTFFRTLIETVGWQDEALRVISHTLSQQQQRTEMRRDVWFNFVGNDTHGKNKIAFALSQLLFGNSELVVTVDLGHQETNGRDVTRSRGKTMVDYIFQELYRDSQRLVLLKNLNEADEQLQTSLSMAVQTGKFSDSYGREVNIGNTVFVTTLKSEGFETEPSCYYTEEKVFGATNRRIEISIEKASIFPFRTNVSSPSSLNKRKLPVTGKQSNEFEVMEATKRFSRKHTLVLDLNVPAQDNDEGINGDEIRRHSKAWFENFISQRRVVNVPFKPFDFDQLAERITKDVNGTFHKIVQHTDCLLEIDTKIMELLLGAAYYSDRSSVVKGWIETVLGRGFAEANDRYNLRPGSVLKLVARVIGTESEEQTPEDVQLPNKIVIH